MAFKAYPKELTRCREAEEKENLFPLGRLARVTPGGYTGAWLLLETCAILLQGWWITSVGAPGEHLPRARSLLIQDESGPSHCHSLREAVERRARSAGSSA